jgi:hypothetical protein
LHRAFIFLCDIATSYLYYKRNSLFYKN